MPVMKSLALLAAATTIWAADIRVGIVGTDTSHATEFTKILNDPASPEHVAGARVVAAYKGGSPDVESSRTRVDKFASELASKWGVEIVPDIPTLCAKVDAVLLESVDGRVHLAQARQVIAARKILFIDKPLASTLEDTREIARLAKEAGVPWFSASSLRWGDVGMMKFPDTKGAIVWGPGPLEEHHQLAMSWYAIHAVEALYSIMGRGCEEVTLTFAPDADVVVGRWKDGRLGTVRTLRPYGPFGAVVFREKLVVQSPPDAKDPYGGLVREIVKFFASRTPPFPNDETLEMFSFMDAAQRSGARTGAQTASKPSWPMVSSPESLVARHQSDERRVPVRFGSWVLMTAKSTPRNGL